MTAVLAALGVLAVVLLVLLLVRVSVTRRNIKSLAAALVSHQNKNQDYMQSLSAGLSGVERKLADLMGRGRGPETQPPAGAKTSPFDRMQDTMERLSAQVAELAQSHQARAQVLEREIATLTVSSEARMEEVRATVEARLSTLSEVWNRRVAEMKAASDDRLQKSAEEAARALDEVNLAVSQLQSLVHDKLSQALAVQHGQVDAVLQRLEATRSDMARQLAGASEESDRRVAAVLGPFQGQLEKALDGLAGQLAELDRSVKHVSEAVVTLGRDLEAQQEGLARIESRRAEQERQLNEAMAALRDEVGRQMVDTMAAAQQIGARVEELAANTASGRDAAVIQGALAEQRAGTEAALDRVRQESEQHLKSLSDRQEAGLAALVAGMANVREDEGRLSRTLKEGLQRLCTDTEAIQARQYAEINRLLSDHVVLFERIANEVARLSQQVAEMTVPAPPAVSPTEIGRLTQPSGADRRPAWLPVEPHNPAESYERLMQSRRSGEAESAARASHEFETGILSAAAALRQKYTGVPGIADIVVMLLPVEALYAEVLQRPALCQSLHRDYRVVVASPATLEGLLADSRSRNQTQRV